MKNARSLLIVAILMGLVTSVLVYVYVGNLTQPVDKQVQMVPVVVAHQSLPPRTVLRPELLAVEEIPLDLVNADAVVDVREALGRVVKETIAPGEQVLRSRLFPPGEVPGLPFAIPSGKRAITIAVNEVIGVAGFIKPGDYVDILGTFENPEGIAMTLPVLQNVLVLAVAQDMKADLNEKPRVTTTVTVAATLEEAQKLTLAEEEGYLRVVLRPIDTRNREVARAVKSTELVGYRPQASSPELSPPPPATEKHVVVAVSRPDPNETTVEVIRGVEKTQVRVEKK